MKSHSPTCFMTIKNDMVHLMHLHWALGEQLKLLSLPSLHHHGSHRLHCYRSHLQWLVAPDSLLFFPSLLFLPTKINDAMSGYLSDWDHGHNWGFGAPQFGGSRVRPLSGKKFGNTGQKLIKKKWNIDDLLKFEKNCDQEHPDLARLTVQ